MLPVLSLVAAVSCGGGREKEPDGGDMLQYAPQINEVEVMRLERTDFQWQLLANGRLVASARSALPFRTAGVLTELDVHNGQRVSEGDVLARQDSREKRRVYAFLLRRGFCPEDVRRAMELSGWE